MHYSKHFMYIYTFNPFFHLMCSIFHIHVTLAPFNRRRNWDTDWLRNSLKVIYIVSGLLEFLHRQFSSIDCSFFFFSRQRNILKTPSKVCVKAHTCVCIELSRLKGCNNKAASFPPTNALSNLPYGARPFLNTIWTPGRLHSFPVPSEIRKGTPDTWAT